MRPIIQYRGELYEGIRAFFASLQPYAEPLWITFGCVYVAVLVVWAVRPFIGRRLRPETSDGSYPVYATWLLLGLLILRLPQLTLDEQNVDEGQWIASAATLIADPRFWISVDGTTSGPLNVYPLTLPYYLGGAVDYSTIRLTGLLLGLVPALGLLGAACRLLFGGTAARLALIPPAVALAFPSYSDSVAYNSEQFPTGLLALALYLAVRLWKGRLNGWGVTVLGLVLGCIPYTKLQAVPPALVLGAGVLGLIVFPRSSEEGIKARGRQQWGRLIGLVAGALVPTAVVVVYCGQHGIAEYVFQSYILANLGYAETGSFHRGATDWVSKLTYIMPRVYGIFASTRLVYGLMPLVAATAVWIGLNRSAAGRYRLLSVFSLVWFGSVVYATLQPGNKFAHYQILSYVPAFWLIGSVTGILVNDPGLLRYSRQLVLIGVAVFGLSGIYLAFSTPKVVVRQAVEAPRPLLHPNLVQQVKRYAAPNERLAIWGWYNRLHPETGLLMATRFIPLYYPVIPGEQQAYFLGIYVDDLLRDRPVVFLDTTPIQKDYRGIAPERYPAVRNLLERYYRHVGEEDGIRIFVRNDRVLPDRP